MKDYKFMHSKQKPMHHNHIPYVQPKIDRQANDFTTNAARIIKWIWTLKRSNMLRYSESLDDLINEHFEFSSSACWEASK